MRDLPIDEMPGFTQQLQDLMASLINVLNAISGNSNAIINGIQQLNQTVLAIESNANNAVTSSQTAFTVCIPNSVTVSQCVDSDCASPWYG